MNKMKYTVSWLLLVVVIIVASYLLYVNSDTYKYKLTRDEAKLLRKLRESKYVKKDTETIDEAFKNMGFSDEDLVLAQQAIMKINKIIFKG